jgi:hypothetical protein
MVNKASFEITGGVPEVKTSRYYDQKFENPPLKGSLGRLQLRNLLNRTASVCNIGESLSPFNSPRSFISTKELMKTFSETLPLVPQKY